MHLGFSKLLRTLSCGKICIYLLRVHLKKSESDIFDDEYAIFTDFLYKGICCGYSFELHRQVNAIQMSTLNILLNEFFFFFRKIALILYVFLESTQNQNVHWL